MGSTPVGQTCAVIVDCAVYESGVRREGTLALVEALEAGRSSQDGFVWIGVHEPDAAEFDAMAREFQLHPLAVEDAIHAHQRAKLEKYGDTLFVVLKATRYVDPEEVIDVSQIMVFMGDDFIVTVRHGTSSVPADVRRQLEADPARLKSGPPGVLHAIVDRVVDDYGVVLRDLNMDVDEIEQAVFSSERQNHARRIYALKREVVEFRGAVAPLADPLEDLASGRLWPLESSMLEYFRDVHDHVQRVAERLEGIDALLSSALSANLAQVGVRQNEDMRRISAWVAIIAMPTMIAGLYGMNFEHMPELGWLLGYPFALGVMAVACIGLYVFFRRRGWL